MKSDDKQNTICNSERRLITDADFNGEDCEVGSDSNASVQKPEIKTSVKKHAELFQTSLNNSSNEDLDNKEIPFAENLVGAEGINLYFGEEINQPENYAEALERIERAIDNVDLDNPENGHVR